MPVSLGLRFMNFLGKYWLHLSFAIIAGLAVWHYMDLRGDRDHYRNEYKLEKENSKKAWRNVNLQNVEIKKLHESYVVLGKTMEVLVKNNSQERQKLDDQLSSMGDTLTRLRNTPPAATLEEQCRDATLELRDTSEVIELFPTPTNR